MSVYLTFLTFAGSHEVTVWNQVWLVESGAGCHFHPLSSSHGYDRGLQHQLRVRLRFRRRNRESQYISLCLLSRSVSVCLLSVSLSEIYAHSHLFAARHSLKFLEKPQSSSFTNPHPNNPSQTNLYTNTRTHTHARYKNLVYLRELKEGLPHLLFSSFFTRNRVCMLMCACMQRNAVYVL